MKVRVLPSRFRILCAVPDHRRPMYTPLTQNSHDTEADDPGESLLDKIVTFLKRYVIVDEPAYVAIALWIIHTHAIDAADTTPYLAALGPEKRCGKTRLLETL